MISGTFLKNPVIFSLTSRMLFIVLSLDKNLINSIELLLKVYYLFSALNYLSKDKIEKL